MTIKRVGQAIRNREKLRLKKLQGLCNQFTCQNKAEEGYTMCSFHRQYMKKKYYELKNKLNKRCKICNKLLGSENISGYCVKHKNNMEGEK